MAAPTTTNEVTVRRLSEVLVGSDGNGGIKKAVDDKIAAAINALDVTSTGGAAKYISAISETNGKISATATNMDTTPTASSTNAVTSGGVKSALDGKASSTHTHGNITNGGALQTTDITVASGDKLVVTDSSDSSKIARASVSFDGSTTTTALTPKGTFESFAKAADITSAIQALDVSSVGGAGKYISAISETDGKISATATAMDTTPTASSTNAVTSGGVKAALDGKASSTHAHGNITNAGALQTTDVTIANGDKLVITDASDSHKVARASIAFDGSTTSQVLTKKGTFAAVSDIISADYRSIPQDVSKGSNLVVNGSCRMASNYNFSSTTYIPTICNNGSAGSFGFDGTTTSDEYISVDFNKRILFSCDIKNLVEQPSGCWHRIYVNEYDIDKFSIVGQMVLYGSGTLTTLAEDLNPGDTTVHITDASNANWQSTTTYHKGLIFWNYANSYGYVYPPETYSRNVYPYSDSSSLWDNGGVNASTGIITLKTAWSGPTIPAGTKVSRRSSSGYPYPAQINTGDTNWHTISGYMEGVCSAGENVRGSGKFSCGTAFIRVGMLPTTLSNTDSTTGKRAVFTNFYVYELPVLSSRAIQDANGNDIASTYVRKLTELSGSTISETTIFAVNGSSDGFKLTYASPSVDHAETKLYTVDDATSTLSFGNKVGSTYKEAILISNGSATVTGSLSGNATTATTATNANIAKTTDTTNGDKLQIGTGTAVNVTNAKHAASADSATSATNVALIGSVKTTSTTNGDTIQFQAGSGTAGTVTIINAKHAASADSATSATTATNYNTSSGTIKTALDGKASSDHVHGNITNAGTITADTAIANGTKIATVGTDNKVSRSPISFDGSTTTTALTPKGTFEAFAKSGDITSAINALDVSSVGGDGKYISAISEQDGKISATATTMDSAPTASSTNAVTSGGIKTALDAKTDRIVWDAVTKGQTWSRIYKATPTINNTVGCSGVLSIAATRTGVVYNITFLITSSHAGSNNVNIIELASCKYSTVRVRAVASGRGDYYLELYDTSNSIAAGTAQTWNCRYIPVLEATVTTYTAFTDGTTIPSGYSAVNDFTTTIGSSAAAIKNITRSGTTFTATRQDGSTFTFTQQDSNTDTLVKATAKTDNVNYKILATASASPTSGNATEAVYDTDITLNPSTNTISASISGNAATATSAGKLTTARKTYVTLGTASTTTTRDWSGDTTIPVSGTLAIANGGTGASDASGARTNLSVYSKSEVDSMLGGRIVIVASLPSTGSPGVIYYVGPTGSGGDQYDEYIWDTTSSSFVKVGEHSIDLTDYVNTLTAAGSGSVVTGLSKSGNTITWTKGNISLDNLSTWASTSDVTVSSKSYHTYWPIAPTSSNQVYGVSITDGKLYQIYNNKGTYTVRSYDQDNNTTYTNEKLGQGYGTCTTAETTAAKVVALTDYVLVKGGIVAVKFTNGLCASATLNVNSQGAKTIYIHGAAATATTAKEVKALDVAYFMYDGTYYQFLGTDRLYKDAITGLSISGKTITYTKADGSTGTLTTQDTTYTFDGTYNASTNKAATVSTVTNKIAALDVSDISGFGAGKTLATLTETDGKIAATFQNISITKSQVSDFPTSMTPTSHTHGNIANGGTLTDTAAAAAGNDYVVIRDADNSKIQTSTIKGTDVADAVNKKHGHSTLTLSTTAQAYDGTHTLALPSTDPYTSARTPTSHTHGNITNAGAIGTTSGYAVYTTTNGVLTAGTLATSDPTASGNTLSFIDTISQDAKGKITATKKSVTIDTALSSTSTNPVQNKVINTALAGKQNTLTEMTETEVDDLLASLT